MKGTYYNEIDPFCVAWLRKLIRKGLLPDGDVDGRPIQEVRSEDVRGYRQCHFFAGIGGWAYALRLAGVPDHYPLWTGSCPCQSFSGSGKRKGFEDPRHLWPAWFRLIRECRPPIVFGEQVEDAISHGWLDLVSGDLEEEEYAVASAVLGAHSVRSPHKRQRLFFVAHTEGERRGEEGKSSRQSEKRSGDSGESVCMGYSFGEGLERHSGDEPGKEKSGWIPTHPRNSSFATSISDFWSRIDWINGRDGKTRPFEPGIFPLATRLYEGVGRRGDQSPPINENDCEEGRIQRLKGYGNSIVPQVAAEFIRAAMESIREVFG